MVKNITKEMYKKIIKLYGHLESTTVDDMILELRKKNISIDYMKLILAAFKNNATDEKRIAELAVGIHQLTCEQNNKEKFVNRFKKIDWDNIPRPSGATINDLIIGLYTMVPPRRIIDYAYMTYVTDENHATNLEENYCVEQSKLFIFNNYKSSHKYGIQRFDIPDDLFGLIIAYVKSNNINNGEPLLKYREYHKETKFNKRHLNRKLNDIFGTSVDGLRHSYITWLYKTPSNLFDIHSVSYKMGHNIRTHLSYLDKENTHQKTEQHNILQC